MIAGITSSGSKLKTNSSLSACVYSVNHWKLLLFCSIITLSPPVCGQERVELDIVVRMTVQKLDRPVSFSISDNNSFQAVENFYSFVLTSYYIFKPGFDFLLLSISFVEDSFLTVNTLIDVTCCRIYFGKILEKLSYVSLFVSFVSWFIVVPQ